MREIKFRAWDEKGKDMIYSGAKKICYQIEDVKKHTKAFIERLKEKDLYRSLVEKYGKVKLFSLETCDVVDLIEEYYNNKIKETADEEFGPKILKKMEKKE